MSYISNTISVTLAAAATGLSFLQIQNLLKTNPKATVIIAVAGFAASFFAQAIMGSFEENQNNHSTLSRHITNLTSLVGLGLPLQAKFAFAQRVVSFVNSKQKYVHINMSYAEKLSAIAFNQKVSIFNFGFSLCNLFTRLFVAFNQK